MAQSIDWNDDGFLDILDIDECYAKVRQLRGDLVRIHVELKGLRGANQECARQLTNARDNRHYWFKAHGDALTLVKAAEAKRNEWRRKAQEQSDEVQRDWLSPCQKAGIEQKPERASAGEAAIVEAAKALVSKLKVRQLHLRACGQELFCKAELTALWEALGYRSKAAAKLLERLVEVEGLKSQLAHTQNQLATANRAAEWLWGFYDGNTLIAKAGHVDEIDEAWGKLLVAADSTPDAIQLQERLATLDAAESALESCGIILGIGDEFNSPADAIRQMADHIKELNEEHDQLVDRVEDAMGQIEKYDNHIAENLIQYAVEDILERLVGTEAALTMAQNRATELEEAEQYTNRWAHQALDECQVPRNWHGDGRLASIRTRIFWLNQRAGRAEAKLNRVRQEAEHELMIAEDLLRVVKLRAGRAEALAALVNEEMAELLERLACHAHFHDNDAGAARALAASIREALETNNES